MLESWKINVSSLFLAFQQSGGSAGSSMASSRRGTADSGGAIVPANNGSGSRPGHGELDEFGPPQSSSRYQSGSSGGVPQGLPKGISGKAARMLSGSSDGSALESLDPAGRSMGSSGGSGITQYGGEAGN
jgi:hypothetical protein